MQLGQEPAILFIHGLSGCRQKWLENIPAAADDSAGVPDFGASQMPATPISIQGYAETFLALCREPGMIARLSSAGSWAQNSLTS